MYQIELSWKNHGVSCFFAWNHLLNMFWYILHILPSFFLLEFFRFKKSQFLLWAWRFHVRTRRCSYSHCHVAQRALPPGWAGWATSLRLGPGGRSKATTSCLFSESFENPGNFRKKLHSDTWSFSNLIMYYDFYFSTLHRSLFVNPSNRNRSYPECIGIRCRPKASSDTRNTSAMGPCLATGTGFNVCFVKKSYPVTNRLGFFRTFQGHMNQQIYINLLVKKW